VVGFYENLGGLFNNITITYISPGGLTRVGIKKRLSLSINEI
jgi:hypothetical protein